MCVCLFDFWIAFVSTLDLGPEHPMIPIYNILQLQFQKSAGICYVGCLISLLTFHPKVNLETKFQGLPISTNQASQILLFKPKSGMSLT